MSRLADPSLVTGLIEALDGDYDDAREVAIAVTPGGSGTTSASCEVRLWDPDTGDRQVFRVSVSLPEPGDDDYNEED